MIVPAQTQNLLVKPRWVAPVGVMESVVAYNCRKYGMPRPVLAMPMWETAGDRALDYSGHGNHGDLQSTTKWVAEGLEFNGSTDYVTIPSCFMSDPTALTVSMLAKSDNATTEGRPFDYNEEGFYLSIRINQGGIANKIYTFMYDGAVDDIFTTSYSVTDWVHIVVTSVENGNTKLYVNGDYIGSDVATGTFTETAGLGRTIGAARTAAGQFLDGSVTNSIIYDIALSAAQVRFLCDNPYFMYRLPEELYGYKPAAVGAIMNQLQKHNLGADLYNGAIIA